MQTKFVLAYCEGLVDDGKPPNATQAALKAGCTSPEVAAVTANRWLNNIKVVAAIEERKADIARAASLTPELVLRLWMDIAQANPNEITQIRRTCCRHCHGYGHQYQWTEAEYLKKVSDCIDAGKEVPDGMGGFGFNKNAKPHPDCPECGGLGNEEVYVADTRELSPGAARLYAGVQRTKDGIKVNLRDQDAAIANLARYQGMLIDKKELSGPNGGPVPIASLKATDLTDDQLAAFLNADAS